MLQAQLHIAPYWPSESETNGRIRTNGIQWYVIFISLSVKQNKRLFSWQYQLIEEYRTLTTFTKDPIYSTSITDREASHRNVLLYYGRTSYILIFQKCVRRQVIWNSMHSKFIYKNLWYTSSASLKILKLFEICPWTSNCIKLVTPSVIMDVASRLAVWKIWLACL